MRVAALDRIELRPQNLGLEAQRRHGGVLALASAAALDGQVECVLRIAGGLHQPRAEVLQPRRVDPVVVPFQRLQPDADCGWPEQLRER